MSIIVAIMTAVDCYRYDSVAVPIC